MGYISSMIHHFFYFDCFSMRTFSQSLSRGQVPPAAARQSGDRAEPRAASLPGPSAADLRRGGRAEAALPVARAVLLGPRGSGVGWLVIT